MRRGEGCLDAAQAGVVGARDRLHVLGHRVVTLGDLADEVVARREREVGRAVHRIETRRERVDGRLESLAGHVEGDPRARLLADPVALAVPDTLGPPVEIVEPVVQLLGVVGDGEEPLIQVALLDIGATAPADPLCVGVRVVVLAVEPPVVIPRLDLCVGQHRLAVRTPVDRRRAVLDEPLVVEAGEQPLIPAVVLGVTGGYLSGPVVAKAHLPEVRAHPVDATAGPRLGVGVALVGRVLRGEAEGVPPHRVKHVVAGHPPIAGVGVRDGVVADVAHVQRPRGVGEHPQDVGGVLGVVGAVVDALSLPDVLPVLLDLRVVVPSGHSIPRCGSG